jgi:hypothetical protein
MSGPEGIVLATRLEPRGWMTLVPTTPCRVLIRFSAKLPKDTTDTTTHRGCDHRAADETVLRHATTTMWVK